jgi:hypothetical protein
MHLTVPRLRARRCDWNKSCRDRLPINRRIVGVTPLSGATRYYKSQLVGTPDKLAAHRNLRRQRGR